MNMEHSCIQFTDLPDEILMIIFKQVHNVEVLYSFIGGNKRLNEIVHDSTFTNVLTLLNYPLNGSICSLPYPVLNRFCLQILPQIHHKIEWLNLESSSMEHILLSTNYPNLYGLGLYDLEIQRAQYLFTDETVILKFKNQISSLVIDITKSEIQNSREAMIRLIFTLICVMFTNLQYLNFGPSLSYYQKLSFGTSPPAVFSSTLLKLHVGLVDFIDCLYLLDGRFNQLHTLNVHISFIGPLCSTINNKEKLPNLRCFSLHCDCRTEKYDDLVVPLLHRMSNLEKLNLHLIVYRKTFVDGDNIKTNIINHLERLNTFTFNITSFTSYNEINLRSNEDIQQTFKDFKFNPIFCCVDYFQKRICSRCHIYSYPYKLKYYNDIANNFPGGLFEYVREVSLNDERPFEHEFFLRIAQSFPFLEKLRIMNREAQNNKQCRKSENENENLSISEYHHLTQLCVAEGHDDYLEEFLLATKTCLPNNVHLYAFYKQLARVTYNFTRDATRLNCSKITYRYSYDATQHLKDFKDYFLDTDVIRF